LAIGLSAVGYQVIWPLAVLAAMGVGILQQRFIGVVKASRNWHWATLVGAALGQAAAIWAEVLYAPHRASSSREIAPFLMGASFGLCIAAAQLVPARRTKGAPKVVAYFAISYLLAAWGGSFNSYSLAASFLFSLAIYVTILHRDPA